MKNKIKKSQISIFLIISITVLTLLILIVALLNNSTKADLETSPQAFSDRAMFNSYIDSCIRLTFRRAITEIGYSNTTNIERHITTNAKNCPASFTEIRNVEIIQGRINSKVLMNENNNSLILSVNYPLTIQSGLSQFSIRDFYHTHKISREQRMPLDHTGLLLHEVYVSSSDNLLDLSIPQGTRILNTDGSTVESINITLKNAIDFPPILGSEDVMIGGIYYEIKPHGTTFNKNVTLMLRYDEFIIPQGVDEESLFIKVINEDANEIQILSSHVDTINKIIYANISSFSYFALIGIYQPTDNLDIINCNIYGENFRCGYGSDWRNECNCEGEIYSQTQRCMIEGNPYSYGYCIRCENDSSNIYNERSLESRSEEIEEETEQEVVEEEQEEETEENNEEDSDELFNIQCEINEDCLNQGAYCYEGNCTFSNVYDCLNDFNGEELIFDNLKGVGFAGFYSTKWDGSYGGGQCLYRNPATNACSCPQGYSAFKTLGATGIAGSGTSIYDNNVFICYNPSKPGLYEFGGFYGKRLSCPNYRTGVSCGTCTEVNQNNIFSNSYGCPEGFTSRKIKGDNSMKAPGGFNIDLDLWYCYRDLNLTQKSFISLKGGGSLANFEHGTGHFNNFIGGRNCPQGYTRLEGGGGCNLDNAFAVCIKRININDFFKEISCSEYPGTNCTPAIDMETGFCCPKDMCSTSEGCFLQGTIKENKICNKGIWGSLVNNVDCSVYGSNFRCGNLADWQSICMSKGVLHPSGCNTGGRGFGFCMSCDRIRGCDDEDLCGNGILDDDEECDLPYDSACPGRCRNDCTCDYNITYGETFVKEVYRFSSQYDNNYGTTNIIGVPNAEFGSWQRGTVWCKSSTSVSGSIHVGFNEIGVCCPDKMCGLSDGCYLEGTVILEDTICKDGQWVKNTRRDENSWGTMTRQEIIDIANEMIDLVWTPAETFTINEIPRQGVFFEREYMKGQTYKGIPYRWWGNDDKFNFYNKVTQTPGGRLRNYGNDCSSFASIALRLPERYTTVHFEEDATTSGGYVHSLGPPGSAANVNLQPGDILNKPRDHVILVGEVRHDGIISLEQIPGPRRDSSEMRVFWSWHDLRDYRPMRRNLLVSSSSRAESSNNQQDCENNGEIYQNGRCLRPSTNCYNNLDLCNQYSGTSCVPTADIGIKDRDELNIYFGGIDANNLAVEQIWIQYVDRSWSGRLLTKILTPFNSNNFQRNVFSIKLPESDKEIIGVWINVPANYASCIDAVSLSDSSNIYERRLDDNKPIITGDSECICGEICNFEINSNNQNEQGYELWWQYHFKDGQIKDYCGNWNNKERCFFESDYSGPKKVWLGYSTNQYQLVSKKIFDTEHKEIEKIKLWAITWDRNNQKSEWSEKHEVNIICNDYLPFQTFYVSSEGNDDNDGSFDNPFRSLEKARDVVRGIENPSENIMIKIKDSFFVLNQTFHLTTQDSGKNDYYVIYSGENTILSGGREFKEWEQQGNLLKTYVGNLDTRNVYINGKRATRARSSGSMGLTKLSEGYLHNTNMHNWQNIQDIEIIGTGSWRQYRCKVSRVTSNRVFLKEPCWSIANYFLPIRNPWYIENAFELLDQPGEWYIDKSSRWLYYYPLPGQNKENIVATIPILETLIQGVGETTEPIKNIIFENFSFAYTYWNEPNEDKGFNTAQADTFHLTTSWDLAHIPGSINFQNAERVTFRNNIFSRFGSSGLVFEKYSKGNLVENNLFYDISGTAIRFGNAMLRPDWYPEMRTRYNVVRGNYIYDVAKEYYSAAGLTFYFTRNNHIINNEIRFVPYSGMSIGWGWDWADSVEHDQGNNLISKNRVDQAMQKMWDGSSIYLLGPQPETIVTNNYITRQKNDYGAIYLDEGSKNVVIENNVLFNNHRSLLIKGKGHTIRDNLWQNRGLIGNYQDLYIYSNAQAEMSNNKVITSYSQIPASAIEDVGISSEQRTNFERDYNRNYFT